jgi:probable rRNA maturation factor
MVIFHKRVAGANQESLDRFLVRAKRAVGLRGALTVLVTSNRELRALNGRFRGQDEPTDVLSFPAEMVAKRRFSGEVAISAEIAARNARRLGHSTAEEVKILTLHGILHLAGYDHEADQGEMARREMDLRKKLGLPVGLIERTERTPPASVSPTGKPPASRPKAAARSARTPRSRSRRAP